MDIGGSKIVFEENGLGNLLVALSDGLLYLQPRINIHGNAPPEDASISLSRRDVLSSM
jgi:hypothetical protein